MSDEVPDDPIWVDTDEVSGDSPPPPAPEPDAQNPSDGPGPLDGPDPDPSDRAERRSGAGGLILLVVSIIVALALAIGLAAFAMETLEGGKAAPSGDEQSTDGPSTWDPASAPVTAAPPQLHLVIQKQRPG